MKILICPDKFKESLKATDVSLHIRNGILKAMPDAICKLMPMADGGEGTVEAMVAATGGRIEKVAVTDPLMRPVEAFFGISGDGKTAFIEMAAASGLALLSRGERNPLITSSYGTGELICHALDRNCRELIIGIGGSATVDGGTGMASALGVHFTDESGKRITVKGGNLDQVRKIDISALDPRIGKCRISVASDVNNVLTGQTGAAYVFGPQKGADIPAVKILDENLDHLALLIRKELGKDIASLAGGGAAGGMGAGIVAFLNGKIMNGFELIADTAGLSEWIEWSDLVITGEGKMDDQTIFGKTPAGVARMALKFRKPVIGFTGALGKNHEKLYDAGFSALIPIADKPMTQEHSIRDAATLLERASERVFRILNLFPTQNATFKG